MNEVSLINTCLVLPGNLCTEVLWNPYGEVDEVNEEWKPIINECLSTLAKGHLVSKEIKKDVKKLYSFLETRYS